ncbi:uncharacterized protein LOC110985411 [Acanthaster planci]|uniref:Uncharacterized protein LOC110985411 n=1 Tax=Acanthaster planci TaxID=133434 RepID=A0A8B7ZFU2_ACAPL|nr:uncharacterized protein LOC110985411 [Acanthaster planci]
MEEEIWEEDEDAGEMEADEMEADENIRNAGSQLLTTVDEVRAWFGIHILMGFVRIPHYQDYWSPEPRYFNRLISTTMTRSRFDFLSQHLACSNPTTNPEQYPQKKPEMFTDKAHQYRCMAKHPLYHLQPIWDTVIAKCRVNFNLCRNLAKDEAMVKCSGFKGKVCKFFMPLKPTRNGFKLYAIADSTTGYLANFIVPPYRHGQPVKMKDIAMMVATPFPGLYHHIFTDKLYSFLELAQCLLQGKTYLTGVIISSSKDLPRDFNNNPDKNPMHYLKMEMLNKMPRDTFYSRQADQLTLVAWKDS